MRLLMLFLLMNALPSYAQEVITMGNIGKYTIELTIENVDRETGDFIGKYRYAGKSSYLTLKGYVYNGGFLYLEESYKGETSGRFYLEQLEDELVGKWIGENSWHEVVIEAKADVLSKIKQKSLSEYTAETTAAISGTYRNEVYFLNDMWFSSDNPSMELGFNGGAVVLDQIHPDSIQFLVEVVCGPTYHIGYASGVANRSGMNTFECLINIEEEDTCQVLIEVGKKSVSMVAKGTFVCGFGARAYLDHEFVKVSDEVKFEEP